MRPSDALGTSWLNFRQLLKVYLPRRDEKAGILSPCLCLARFVSCSFSSLPFPLSPEHYCIASVFAVTNVGQHKSVCSLFSAQSRCSLLCLKIDSSGTYLHIQTRLSFQFELEYFGLLLSDTASGPWLFAENAILHLAPRLVTDACRGYPPCCQRHVGSHHVPQCHLHRDN